MSTAAKWARCGLEPRTRITDKGPKTKGRKRGVVDRIPAADARVVIPTQKSRKVQRPTDRHRDTDQNLFERLWSEARQYRLVADHQVREDDSTLVGI
jgi:hypothetical protein